MAGAASPYTARKYGAQSATRAPAFALSLPPEGEVGWQRGSCMRRLAAAWFAHPEASGSGPAWGQSVRLLRSAWSCAASLVRHV